MKLSVAHGVDLVVVHDRLWLAYGSCVATPHQQYQRYHRLEMNAVTPSCTDQGTFTD